MKKKISIFLVFKYLLLDIYRFIKFLYYNKNTSLFLETEKVLNRLNICRDCDYFIRKEDSIFFSERCSICGCFLKLKTKLKFEECPLKKW